MVVLVVMVRLPVVVVCACVCVRACVRACVCAWGWRRWSQSQWEHAKHNAGGLWIALAKGDTSPYRTMKRYGHDKQHSAAGLWIERRHRLVRHPPVVDAACPLSIIRRG